MRLGNIFQIQMGQSPKGETVSTNQKGTEFHQGKAFFGDRYLIHSNQYTSAPSKYAPANSLLLCVRAPVGKVNITEREICIGRGLCSIAPMDNMPLLFVYHLFSFFERIFVMQSSGTTFAAITGEIVKNQLIPIPPLAEQQRIVDKLEEILPLVEAYGEKQDTLDKLNTNFPSSLKKSILQEAVQGKLVSQDPNDEPASVLLERIRAEKQKLIKEGKIKKDKNESIIYRRDNSHYEKLNGIERCIDDEIPFEIPESWCWVRLGTVLQKLTDGAHSTPKYVESGIPFISVKDISNGKLGFANCKFITVEEHSELYKRCNPEKGDILLTKVGTTGIPVIVDTEEEFSLFVSVALLKFNQTMMYNKYLIALINSPLVQKQADKNTRGVGNKNWVMRDIANTLIALPPLFEQHRIVQKLNDIFLILKKL